MVQVVKWPIVVSVAIVLTACSGSFSDKNTNVGGLKKTGQTVSYDQSGNEVTDGSLKDDGYYQKGVDSDYSRDDKNGIVTDKVTGLQWQDEAAPVQMETRSNATKYCSELKLGDHNDWRLPTLKELKSIVDYGQDGSAVDPIFQNFLPEYYWSNTLYGKQEKGGWLIDIRTGEQYGEFYLNEATYVRCVR